MAETFFYFHPSDNVAPSATASVETGAEDTDYPVANLTDLSYPKIAAPAKTTGTSGAFLLDWGSAQRVDYVVLWHNLDAAVAVSVQMNAANSWGGPTVTTSVTIPAKRADGYTRKVGVDLRPVSGYSTSGYRYLRIHISGTNSELLGLKVLAFSQVRQLSHDFQWGVQDVDTHIAIDMKTDAGIPWAYDIASAPRELHGSALLSDADAERVREWHRACAGYVKPMVLVPEPSGTDAWLVRWMSGGPSGGAGLITSKVTHQRDFVDLNQTQLAFEEITAGDPEWF